MVQKLLVQLFLSSQHLDYSLAHGVHPDMPVVDGANSQDSMLNESSLANVP